MKTASISEIKKELQTLHPSEVLNLCMQIAKYKKENKELLSYLLFESHQEETFVSDIKDQINQMFQEMNKSTLFLAKKTIRKILRTTNKYIKYSGSKQTEVELLMFFSKSLKQSGVNLQASPALMNIFDRQIIKINKAISMMHEDLKHDYNEGLMGMKE